MGTPRRHDYTVTARIHDALEVWAPYAAEMDRLAETWEIDPDDTTWRSHQSYRTALTRPRVAWWPEYVALAEVADEMPPMPYRPYEYETRLATRPPGRLVATTPAPAHAPPSDRVSVAANCASPSRRQRRRVGVPTRSG